MAIYLDDKPIQAPTESLGSALQAASEQLEQTGRVVVEVQIDGQAIVGDELGRRESLPVDDAELRLYSADLRDLAVTTLEQTLVRLDDAKHAQDQAADLLQRDELEQAFEQLSQAIEAWLEAQQAVHRCALLTQVTLDDKAIDGQPVAAITEALIQQLVELKELIAAQDSVALADTLGYEWPQVIEHWRQLVHELIGWIEQSPGSTP